MEKVKFGFGQISKKTPEYATWIFRIVLYAAALANFVVDVVTEIPPDIKVIIAKYSVYAVTLTHGITKMFGITVEPPPNFRR